MRIDALAVRLRPRTATEAADLGVRLCQHAARSVYPCYALVAIPVFVLALLSYAIAAWLPGLLIWWAKPWLDRTILFVLSRAAFGQPTTPADVWQARHQVWWRGLWFTLTVRRLSMWRSLTEPVYQLEGLAITTATTRVHQIRNRHSGPALMMTSAYHMAETALLLALVSLVFWFAPTGLTPSIQDLVTGHARGALAFTFPIALSLSVLFLEPF